MLSGVPLAFEERNVVKVKADKNWSLAGGGNIGLILTNKLLSLNDRESVMLDIKRH